MADLELKAEQLRHSKYHADDTNPTFTCSTSGKLFDVVKIEQLNAGFLLYQHRSAVEPINWIWKAKAREEGQAREWPDPGKADRG